MTKIKEVKERFEGIEEMRGIVTAMKTLAFIEAKKLGRYLADEGRAANSITAAAADFLSFYPMLESPIGGRKTLLIAIGADRGFCGGFNEEIAESVHRELQSPESRPVEVVVVGDRLSTKLQQHTQSIDTVRGATFVEEVPVVLSQVIDLIGEKIKAHCPDQLRLRLLTHLYEADGITVIEPLAELQRTNLPYTSRPILNLDPHKFFLQLLDQYFCFLLYHAFYSSLMAENAKRIMHLDAALRRLEEDVVQLKRRYNQARQEQITEEIEILIMNITDERMK